MSACLGVLNGFWMAGQRKGRARIWMDGYLRTVRQGGDDILGPASRARYIMCVWRSIGECDEKRMRSHGDIRSHRSHILVWRA